MLLLYTSNLFTHWIHSKLLSTFGNVGAFAGELLIVGISIILLVVVMAIIMIYMERKIAAFMQLRLGPMRVGFWGSMQAFADVVKLLLKECLTPDKADKFLFGFAPFLVLVVSFLALAPISYAPGFQLWNPNIGILYITAVSSIGVIGILMAGWSSNNKYSLLGAMRSGAQIVSYELSAGLSILAIIVMCGTLSTQEIIQSQANGWWIFKGHIPAIIAFFIFAIASTAELNRAPFDLAEAEQELTAGFHTEYSGMQFAMFFLSEYTNMFIVSMIGTTVFLGGWMPLHIGGLDSFNHVMDYIPHLVWFFGKVFVSIFVIIWFRWTFPRMRIDQLLKLEWKYLLPISLVNLVLAAFISIMGWHF
jgi:NADH-quinone oxidoreductase subunit H